MLPALATRFDALETAGRPVLVYRDDATGERVALSAATLGGWAARTASLLRDGCGLKPGDSAAVLLPPHWQTAAVLMGAWSVGLSVAYQPWATAGLAEATSHDALFVSQQRQRSWLENVPDARHRFILGLAPGGPALTEVQEGYRDYVAEIGRYPDFAPDYRHVAASDTATPDGTTYLEWAGIANGIAEKLGLRPGDRVLVDAAKFEQPVHWLLAPLSAGASIVLCANLDRGALQSLIADEGVTHVL